MSLHLLKMQPDMARLVRWARGQRLLSGRREDDLGYALHAIFAAAFGELAPRPFLLRQDLRRPASVLAYSAHGTEALREHASSFAEPDVSETLDLDTLAGKPMPDRFAPGRRLGFGLRARPTIRIDADGDRDRVREVDAFRPPGTDEGSPDRAAVYQAWLARRLLAGGAALERASLDNFRRSDVQRRDKARALRPVGGPDASFTGVLRVDDPERFASLLAGGVGRHRAFGFGMLLLRPA